MSMARNYSSNNSGGGGCLLLIIVILWLLGNVALFGGSFDELPLLCILAIFGDIFIIVALIAAIPNSSANNNTSQASSNQPASQQQIGTRSTPQSAPITVTTVNEDNSKLNLLKAKYRVPAIPSISKSVDPLQNEMESFQCIEVLQSVNKAISRRSDYVKKMKSIKEDIDGILACPGCTSDRERLKYIKGNEETLQQKKDEYTTASKEMKKIQVVLLSKGKIAFNKIFSALDEIYKREWRCTFLVYQT